MSDKTLESAQSLIHWFMLTGELPTEEARVAVPAMLPGLKQEFAGLLIRCSGSALIHLCMMRIHLRRDLILIVWFDRFLLSSWRNLAKTGTEWIVNANPRLSNN
ncbi:MAG: hypothetical protein COC17_05875 [Hyphomicrobiales bacterium]|nr:hypothetical protein [Hyphomicrobiales bacterium]PCH50269.1 MAG: hypothetical protein COC17_05875 [Hyphomicrobiales bacterium]